MNKKPKLTIGMAHFDDFHGAYFTIQAIKTYTPAETMAEVEIIVIDNTPHTAHGKMLRDLVDGWSGPYAIRYIPFPDTLGTSQTRNAVFAHARGEWVMCVDCHVLLAPGAIQRFLDYGATVPESSDLFHGPIVYDDNTTFSSHFDPTWREEMWGIWANAWAYRGTVYSTKQGPDGRVLFCDLMTGTPLAEIEGDEIPAVAWPQHELALSRMGHRMLGAGPDEPPFEIPAQGLGLFACRRDAWLGFNSHFRGFGGEECYIHAKFRQAGHRVWCLPFLRWGHRFGRPDGVRYPLSRFLKVRNYVLGFQELGLPLDPVHRHFVQSKLFSQFEWDRLIANPEVAPKLPATPQPATPGASDGMLTFRDHGLPQPPREMYAIDDLFEWLAGQPRDLDQHMPILRAYAGRCHHVTEFTKRRESTMALIAGRPHTVVTYSTEPDLFLARLHGAIPRNSDMTMTWTSHVPNTPDFDGDVLNLNEIEPTEMLFVDTHHNGPRIRAELDRFGAMVAKYIVLHDTHAHGEQGDDGGPGMSGGVTAWLTANPSWFVAYHTDAQYGLTILSQVPADRPPARVRPWATGYGTGTELKKLLARVGVHTTPNCKCNARAAMMDRLGPGWCRDNRETIIGWLNEEIETRTAALYDQAKGQPMAARLATYTKAKIMQEGRRGVSLLLDRAIKRGAKTTTAAEGAW